MKRTSKLLAVGMAVALACATATMADQVSANLEVSAKVLPNCRVTLTPLSFGSYDPLGQHSATNLDATATMLLTCTRNSRATINMDGGRNAPPASTLRGLIFGDQRLDYQIFRDSARTQVWGQGANALEFVASGDSTAAREVTVYGRIPAGQEVNAGTYTDLVTATVDF